jgi:transposase-like protein
MTQKISSAMQTTQNPPRIPVAHGGIQYNSCKNPKCSQFGVHIPEVGIRGKTKGAYSIVSAGKNYPTLKCNACGEMPPLKSNKGIADEVERLSAYLKEEEIFCPNDKPDEETGEVCSNHANRVPVGTKKAYIKSGKNSVGSPRMKCCGCGKVFLVGSKPAVGQHDTHMNREIFSMLVNKVPLSRIVKMLNISWAVLYRRIDFIHSQCMKFAAHREAKLRDMPLKRVYLAVDAQDYLVNWTERKDKRNVVLKAITAVDNATGYAFVNALNFDDTVNRLAIERDAAIAGDNALAAPHRKHARFWLEADYKQSAAAIAKRIRKASGGDLADDIALTYEEAAAREDIETFDEKDKVEKLPDHGMQIHSEYTMIAMFHHLKKMLGNVDAWRFFLDQEAGIRAACLSTFADEIKARKAEAFYVRIEKELVQEEKIVFINKAKERFAAEKEANPFLSDDEIRVLMIKEEIMRCRAIGQFKDAWVQMPMPSMSEPNKAVCWLTAHEDFRTDDGEIDENHIAWLHNKASLHAVDNFFMKTRRSIQMCERPVRSSGNASRIWSAYQAYNPSVLKKMLEIFRVHNFTDLPMQVKKAERKTPAMRLGLANAPLDLRDVLYFED